MSKFRCLSKKIRTILAIAMAAVVCIVIVAGIQYFAMSNLLSRHYEPDLIISSPDGQQELVVREFTCLGGAGAEIYLRKLGQNQWYHRWLEKQIGTVGTDDYYQTFTHGTYDVEWERDKITIYYYKGVPAENPNDFATWQGVLCYDLGI